MEHLHVRNVSDAACAALYNALEQWQREFAQGTEVRDLLANDIREYTMRLQASNSAATIVTVEVSGANPTNDAAYIYGIETAGGKSQLAFKMSNAESQSEVDKGAKTRQGEAP